jgi:hypothetical protein
MPDGSAAQARSADRTDGGLEIAQLIQTWTDTSLALLSVCASRRLAQHA